MNALRRSCLAIALATAGLAAGAGLAPAQQPASTADTAGTFTLQDENASLSTAKLTDRYYVNGLRLGYTSAPTAVPDFLTGVGRAVWGDGQQRFGFDLSQQIFTPGRYPGTPAASRTTGPMPAC